MIHMEWLVNWWSEPGETVLDPFCGSGTIPLAADRLGRDCIGIELNPDYAEMARRRIAGDSPLFAEVAE
jgi:DNA modification methylase